MVRRPRTLSPPCHLKVTFLDASIEKLHPSLNILLPDSPFDPYLRGGISEHRLSIVPRDSTTWV